MGWIREKSLTHIVALLAVFATLTGFSLIGTESLLTAISSPVNEDGLFELIHHFPDQAAEPAILGKTDDSGFSIFRFINHRFFVLFGPICSGSASSFSRFQSHSTENFFDNKSAIQIKLRI